MTGTIIEIKSGKHKGEHGVVIGQTHGGFLRVLTLNGDTHIYNSQGCEIESFNKQEATHGKNS